MKVAGHLFGGAAVLKQIKAGETMVRGIPAEFSTSHVAGLSNPAVTTAVVATLGITEDAATYSTTQGDAEGVVTIDVRPDAIVRARMSGSTTAGTALTTLSNTSAEAAGLTITDADVGSADMDGGTVWHPASGESRVITTFSSAASVAVTVPFSFDIAAGYQFHICPWALVGEGSSGSDGNGEMTMTSDFLEADASAASGAGAAVSIVDLILQGSLDSFVEVLLADHVHRVYTT